MGEFDAISGNLVKIDQSVEEVVRQILDCVFEVHRRLGPGYLESVYEEALAIEFEAKGLRFSRQHPVSILYRDRPVGETRLDYLVEGSVIVEIKAVEKLADIHRAQVISYLKVTGLSMALLINFNVPLLKDGIKRIVRTKSPS